MSLNFDSALPNYFPQELINSSRIVELAKDDRLFLTGDKVEGIYFVLSGELKAVRPMLKERDVVMARARSGDYFAVSALTIDRFTCNAFCINPAEILFLPKIAIFEALKIECFALGFSLALATNAGHQCNRYERLRLNRSRDRLLHFLTCESDQSGQINWKLPLTEWASELAIEPETLYRAISELETEGEIRRNRCNFQLLRSDI